MEDCLTLLYRMATTSLQRPLFLNIPLIQITANLLSDQFWKAMDHLILTNVAAYKRLRNIIQTALDARKTISVQSEHFHPNRISLKLFLQNLIFHTPVLCAISGLV
jgi:hypothetical protein